jgi:hypothetical protein
MTPGLLITIRSVVLLGQRFTQNGFEKFLVHGMPFGNHLAILDKVDGILASYLLGIEGAEAEEGFAHHVDRQPVEVVILVHIPEELLLLADTLN